MSRYRFAIFTIGILILHLASGIDQCAAQSVEESAKWVPASSNYVAIVRAAKIFESPLAKEERWKTQRSRAFKSGVETFPPTTESILFASQIDYEYMQPIWNLSVFKEAKEAIDIVNVSKRVGGNLEKLAGLDALVLPNDAFLVQVDDKTLVTMAPANRQLTARMIRSKRNGGSSVSPYLSNALKFADQNADIIIAMDFDSVIAEEAIAERLGKSNVVESSEVEGFARILSKIQGVTLGVTVKNKISGAVKIDFSENPSLLAAKGKDLFIDVLKRNGMMIDDMESWISTVQKNQILIQGEFSPASLRQIGSLLQQPLLDSFTGTYSDDGGEVNAATRSKQYFSDVQTVIESLRSKNLKSMASYSKWFDRYSRDINELPVLGVDEALLAYGDYVADQFREIASSLDTSNLDRASSVASYGDTNYRYSGVYPSYGYRSYGSYGYTIDNSRNRRVANSQGTMKGANEAKSMLREIDSKTAEIRNAMSKKYELEF